MGVLCDLSSHKILHLKSSTSRETDRVKMKVLILLLCMMTIYTSQAKKYLVETATNGDYKMKLKHDDGGDYLDHKLTYGGERGNPLDYKMMLKRDDDGDYKMMLKHDDDGDNKIRRGHMMFL